MMIKQRIQDQITHFGKDERILFEGKDFERELEDVNSKQNVSDDWAKAE